ncbi:hypothetical protein BDR26DRAFT_863803 [Obelidium mucronatum]|nr:hypothetical protein BDR26DRAFT_863803 [Obelidium mucronatum]
MRFAQSTFSISIPLHDEPKKMQAAIGCVDTSACPQVVDAHQYLLDALALFPSDDGQRNNIAADAEDAGEAQLVRLVVAHRSFRKSLRALQSTGRCTGLVKRLSARLPRALSSNASSRASSPSAHSSIGNELGGSAEIPSDEELAELERIAILKAPKDRLRLQAKHDKIVAQMKRLLLLGL